MMKIKNVCLAAILGVVLVAGVSYWMSGIIHEEVSGDEGAGRWEVHRHEVLGGGAIHSLGAGDGGSIWVGLMPGGLAHREDGHWQEVDMSAIEFQLPGIDDAVQATLRTPHRIVVGHDGGVWVSFESVNELARYHDGEWKRFNAQNSELPDARIADLAVGNDGSLWAGLLGGLARYHEGRWHVLNTQDGGLPVSGPISALAIGREGDLWVGTNVGELASYHRGAWRVHTTDPFDALGTLAPNGDEVVILNDDFERPGNIRALAVDHGGVVWGASLGEGLFSYDHGEWERYDSDNSELPGDIVEALSVGPDGAVWVAARGNSEKGLVRIHGEDWRVVTPEDDSLPGGVLSELAVSGDGTVWIAGRSLVSYSATGD